jgi:hypothetical protein
VLSGIPALGAAAQGEPPGLVAEFERHVRHRRQCVNLRFHARVFDFGNRAWVEALSKRPSAGGGAPADVAHRIRAVRVGGDWKVQPM